MITSVVDGKLQMRCVTLRQPYLHLIFDLPVEHRKTIENRTRSITSEMGPILMSASAHKTTDRLYFQEALEGAARRGVPSELLPRPVDLEQGVLYGCVRLRRMLARTSLEDGLFKWKFPGHVGYLLDTATALRLPTRKISGSQGVFYVTLTDEEQDILSAAGMLP